MRKPRRLCDGAILCNPQRNPEVPKVWKRKLRKSGLHESKSAIARTGDFAIAQIYAACPEFEWPATASAFTLKRKAEGEAT